MLTEPAALEEMIEKISDFCVYWLFFTFLAKPYSLAGSVEAEVGGTIALLNLRPPI